MQNKEILRILNEIDSGVGDEYITGQIDKVKAYIENLESNLK